jgi:hypothetical protein
MADLPWLRSFAVYRRERASSLSHRRLDNAVAGDLYQRKRVRRGSRTSRGKIAMLAAIAAGTKAFLKTKKPRPPRGLEAGATFARGRPFYRSIGKLYRRILYKLGRQVIQI